MFYFMLILVLFQISCVSSERKLRIPPMTKYLIENDVCYVPYFDPWSLQSNYKNQSGFINFCPEIEPLVYFERTNLKINVYIKDFLLENSMELECCLSNITRNMSKSIPDNSFSESSCEVFENSTEIKNDVIRTICYKNDTKKKLYEDIHGFFIDTNLNRTDEEVSSPLIGYNVLIILVDSLSQNNFLRHLQNTHRFLINSGYDILEKSRNGYISKPARSCRNCNSIFREHSHYRTCKEAGIDKYWCTCLNKKFEQFQNGNESNTYYVDL
nr:uncharacterized protein LOC111413971 [Onthophagus taurus]